MPSSEATILLRTLKGHTASIWGCAFSPDGAWLISSSRDNTLKMWAAASGRRIRTLKGHTENVWACAVSSDGARIVSASNDQTLKIWEAASGHELHTLCEHSGGIWGCAFSPDGKWIVSASDDEELKIWDLGSGAELRSLSGHPGGFWGCAVSPDGARIVSANFDHTLKLWDAASGRALRVLSGHTDQVSGCAFSPDGARIVSASKDHTLRVWDSVTCRELCVLKGHTDYVSACTFSPDGRWILSASWDRTLRCWDPVNAGEQFQIELPGSLTCVDLHPWRPLVVCGDSDGRVNLLELPEIDYGPIILTATRSAEGLAVRCPACWEPFDLETEQPGGELICPTDGCSLGWKINPFMIQSEGLAGRQQEEEQDPGSGEDPIPAIAIEYQETLCVNCPVCHHFIPISVEVLGTVLPCPCAGCNALLKVDPHPIILSQERPHG